jgi:hypothetical protein
MGIEPKQPARTVEPAKQNTASSPRKSVYQVKNPSQNPLISAKIKAVGIDRPGRRRAARLFDRHKSGVGWRGAGVGRQEDTDEAIDGTAIGAVGKWATEVGFEKVADALNAAFYFLNLSITYLFHLKFKNNKFCWLHRRNQNINFHHSIINI